jgi:uncharacterized protein YjiS (DUF1127 family)
MQQEWSRLTERELADIGLSRMQIEIIAVSRAARCDPRP